MTTKKKTEPVQEAPEAEVPETPVSQEVAEVPEAPEAPETPVKEEPKKHDPLDYINKAIELVEAKNAAENCMEYRVAITALNEAKMFISKKGG
jgi:hypothetical protein